MTTRTEFACQGVGFTNPGVGSRRKEQGLCERSGEVTQENTKTTRIVPRLPSLGVMG